MALQLSFVNFKQGTYILIEGHNVNDRFYIIQKGNVKITHGNSSRIQPVVLGPGDFVGVISCMSNRPQIEAAKALTDVVCISVRRDQYPELIRQNTPVAMKIIFTFASRMRTLNETLMKLTVNNSAKETPEHIFHVAEYYSKERQFNIACYAYYQFLKACPHSPNFEQAKKMFIRLKKKTDVAYFEPTSDLIRVYPTGNMIMSECQSGAEMFIIKTGSVKISKIVNGTEVTLAVLQKGDMFGEMALLENKPRSASAIANSDCKLMVVNRQNFNQMVTTQPQLIASLTTMLADRLWVLHRQMMNTEIPEVVPRMIDMLSLQIEKSHQRIGARVPVKTDLTPEDIAHMCGLSREEQGMYLYRFTTDPHIKLIEGNKIVVPDSFELLKQAAFNRKQKPIIK